MTTKASPPQPASPSGSAPSAHRLVELLDGPPGRRAGGVFSSDAWSRGRTLDRLRGDDSNSQADQWIHMVYIDSFVARALPEPA